MLPRERFAWIWLWALVVVFTAYFTVVALAQQSHAELTFLTRITWLAIALSTLAVVAITAHLFGRRDGSRGQVDERDRLIALRSAAVAYYVLIGGMILVGCVMPFTKSGWELVHAALFFIALAEIVHSGLIVLSYRRGLRV